MEQGHESIGRKMSAESKGLQYKSFSSLSDAWLTEDAVVVLAKAILERRSVRKPPEYRQRGPQRKFGIQLPVTQRDREVLRPGRD